VTCEGTELRGLFGGVYEVASNPTKPLSAEDIVQTQSHIRELTKVCEREVHEVVLVCHARTSPNARICREGAQG
jgi:hypothetical protein